MQVSDARCSAAIERHAIVLTLLAMCIWVTEAVRATPQAFEQDGRWIEPAPVDGDYSWEFGTMHAIHMSGGQILYYYRPGCEDEDPRLRNPYIGVETRVPTGSLLLAECHGHVALPDQAGSLLLFGGGCSDASPTTQTVKFNREGTGTTPWQTLANMSIPRWYPTATLTHDSKVVVFGGTILPPHKVEVYDPSTNTWDVLQSTERIEVNILYPFMFQTTVPGKLVCAGPSLIGGTEMLDLYANNGEGQWTPIAFTTGLAGDRGSAVMYEPDKVLMCGGHNGSFCAPDEVITGATGIIDVGTADPEWILTPDMSIPRRDHNLVITPGGVIVALGGLTGDCPPSPNCDLYDPVLEAERFDPEFPAEGWEILASMTIPRGYHSAAVLLSDATILVSGGEDTAGGVQDESISGERFEPPYLFTGNTYAPRPIIGHAPSTIFYGNQFTVNLGGAQTFTISKVCLIRPAANSHGFDQEQRRVPLTFTQPTQNSLQITAPAHSAIAPPGHYMLFVVANTGVPSRAAWVYLKPAS